MVVRQQLLSLWNEAVEFARFCQAEREVVLAIKRQYADGRRTVLTADAVRLADAFAGLLNRLSAQSLMNAQLHSTALRALRDDVAALADAIEATDTAAVDRAADG